MSHILQVVNVAGNPPTVLSRFASIEGIRDWWTTDVSGDSNEGGEFVVGFGPKSRQRLRVVERTADRIVWEPCSEQPKYWRGTRIVASVTPVDEPLPWNVKGTLLLLEHSGWETFDDTVAACNTQWAHLLGGFKYMCEADTASPARWENK